MKIVLAAATALTLLVSGVATAEPPLSGAVARPKAQRVMSLNLCTDQLLLQLVPPERITSVTYLSRLSERSYLTAEAAGVAINYGSAEEVWRQHPDLILAGQVSTPETRALLKRAGAEVVEVPAAENFDQIRSVVRLVAHAVGEDEKGNTLLVQMDRTLAELAATAPAQPIKVASWNAGGDVPGTNTLFDAILTAAGGVNVAARVSPDPGSARLTSFDLEELLSLHPDMLAFGSTRLSRLDLGREQLDHPIIRKYYAGRQIAYPETLYSCGLPQSAAAARDLRRALLDSGAGPAAAP